MRTRCTPSVLGSALVRSTYVSYVQCTNTNPYYYNDTKGYSCNIFQFQRLEIKHYSNIGSRLKLPWHQDVIFSTLKNFCSYVVSKYKTDIHLFQCDNGWEFNNHLLLNFFRNIDIKIFFWLPHNKMVKSNVKFDQLII